MQSDNAALVHDSSDDQQATSPAETRIRSYYELVDRLDIPALLELFALDAEYFRPGYQPIVGREELARFYRNQRVIRQGTHTVNVLVEQGSRIAVRGRFDGELRDGSVVSVAFSDFFEFAPDGAISRRDTYFFAPLV
jgi:ketosteroid isomerase-like protein